VLGQTGALPLLQFTLQQLFERRNGHRLTQQAYKDIGKVSGALAKYADETYEHLPKEQQPLARVLFLRLLEAGVSEQDATRRRAPVEDFAFDDPGQTRLMQETMQVFVAARLLTTNANESTGKTTIEVSHEALIREWPLLVGWLREARDVIPLQQAVSKDVEEWEHYRKPKDRLYRGTQLKEAQTWAARYMVSGREMAFLRASERQQQRSFLFRLTIIFLILVLAIPVGLLGVPQLILFAQQNGFLPITVTSLQDTGPGSLTAAIQAASPKNKIIHFDAGLKGQTIELTNNLVFDKSLTLMGPDDTTSSGFTGPTVTISSGKHDYQIKVDPDFSVTIKDLAFNASVLKTSDFLYNSGNLTLENTNISNNTMTGSNNALIYNNGGQIAITNSIISNNIGEIYNTGGQITITKSIISNTNHNNTNKNIVNNVPIYNSNKGSLTITDSTIEDNISSYNGGSIYNGSQSQLTIIRSTISGNSISSISGSNTTYSGGGIANQNGTLTIMNSTIAGNTADGSGGGIVNMGGTTILSFCTIYDNSASAGGGIAVIAGSVTISNSIVAGNKLISGGQSFNQHITGMLISQGYNLLQNTAPQHTSASDTSNIAALRFMPVQNDTIVPAGDLIKIFDPQGLQYFDLQGLQYFDSRGQQGYIGLTRTYKLLSSQSNPAVDKIPLAACDIPNIYDSKTHKYTDQRGVTRPDDHEQFCDVGAYESSG
jgi:hypothetical protein